MVADRHLPVAGTCPESGCSNVSMGRKRYTARQKLGALVIDVPRFARYLCLPAWTGAHWTLYRNRQDRIAVNPDGRGVQCDWDYTRQLHLCNVFPCTARILLRRALAEWPILLVDFPRQIGSDGCCSNRGNVPHDPPEVSFIIGHRGRARLPHLLQVLKSIATQREVRFECIVVEQDVEPTVRELLPGWVRYVHTPIPPDVPYCRSWAFNVAARMARSPLFIFHDNDMLVPAGYGAESAKIVRAGFDAVNLKRFVFYLAETEQEVGMKLAHGKRVDVDHVVEHLEAGGSVVVSRDAFEGIGGFDEDFVGWGGEDNEFWDRCRTRKVWNYGYLPILHLWHDGQPGKRAVGGLGAHTSELTIKRRGMDPRERINELRMRERGTLSWSEKADRSCRG